MATFNFAEGFTPSSGHPESKEPIYGRTIIPLAKLWMRFGQRLQIFLKNPENVPREGGAILAVNHTGYWDFVYGPIPAHFNGGRLVRFMAKKEIWDSPVAGPLMSAMRHIPVDRADGAASVKEAVRRLRGGELVGIFPEATISRSFEIKELRQGAAVIAEEAEVPLIPMIIWGSQRIWTKSHKPTWFPKDAKLVMVVGKSVPISDDSVETTERLRAAMQSLLEEAREEYVKRFGPMPEGEFWVPSVLGGSAPTLEEATIQDRQDHENRKKQRAEAEAAASGRRKEEQQPQPTGINKVLAPVTRWIKKLRK
ncbi:1-acyl-sn-glycerol-3-phosphate acyltransferase [Corynebacterium dentalis]|uniref:lysophospholipid acyltransferase family protein n=1 Tax=Corynebacterium dentalis TaxID=2014528 RepID=UPI0025946F5A|nr:lysophospholipid acyltransferase family protein [Corynebacterium dentalis]